MPISEKSNELAQTRARALVPAAQTVLLHSCRSQDAEKVILRRSLVILVVKQRDRDGLILDCVTLVLI